ncbi:MAG: ABC transporter related protein [Parcubacteria group bacterium GW2011_GWC2_42_6]|nr:MAG: ABC transporter related protein [Parcubacteria group bacterium GW2011_GWA2_42_11]KKS68121.1 MAG: ABC transporter related protein [Parcubacteria group bacterium GW2011_GWC2_42_6]
MVLKYKISTLLKLFKRGFGPYKWQILLITILGFVSSLLEGVGINALIPLFSFVTGRDDASNDKVSQIIQAIFNGLHIDFGVKYLLIFISLLFVFKAIFSLMTNLINAKINAGYEERMRSHLFGVTLKAGWPYLLGQRLGHLETVLMTNVRTSATLLGYISTVISLATSLITYTIIALNISFNITLITLGCSVLLIIFFQPIVKRVRKISIEEEGINRRTAHHVNENILGMKTVKSMHVEEKVIAIAKDYFVRLKNIRIKTNLLLSLSGALIEPFSLIFICVIFAMTYKMPAFNLAALAAVVYLIKQIFSYAQQLQKYLMGINSAFPYLRKVLDYEKQALNNKEEIAGVKSFNFNKALEFKNVRFSYNENQDILAGMNFKITKGTTLGLIGPSGAGKTTIVDLILRLFAPTAGEILIDGGNIAEINLKEWRQNIGYVSQDIFLLNDTIANNIKFYNETISEAAIREAARLANIEDFINECPNKFETEIGERGVMLSAGQRQRIIIARILARQPKFLIFDEATSALDNESEAQIQKVLQNLRGKITVLIVAHRLSTVLDADQLLVLDNGIIAEQGRPRTLLEDKNSYFYKTYNIKNN